LTDKLSDFLALISLVFSSCHTF